MQRVCALVAATALLACGEPTATLGRAVRLSVSPQSLNLVVGESGVLFARAFDGRDREVNALIEWSSANPAVASVSTPGIVTAVAAGTTTVTATAGTLSATASVSVRPPNPAIQLYVSPFELALIIRTTGRLSVEAYDGGGKLTNAPIEWTSADTAIATVGKRDGMVTAISVGSTTVTAASGAVRASATVRVEPENFLVQWASSATASSEYTSAEWSAKQATGQPDVPGCADHPKAWASLDPDVDWLELTYAQPVHASEIRIHEVWASGSIVKVEVKDLAGTYHTVYTAEPTVSPGCPRFLIIPVTNVSSLVSVIRVSVDQRLQRDWDEIDAVRLIGYR